MKLDGKIGLSPFHLINFRCKKRFPGNYVKMTGRKVKIIEEASMFEGVKKDEKQKDDPKTTEDGKKKVVFSKDVNFY